jgi:hypothetical protein
VEVEGQPGETTLTTRSEPYNRTAIHAEALNFLLSSRWPLPFSFAAHQTLESDDNQELHPVASELRVTLLAATPE